MNIHTIVPEGQRLTLTSYIDKSNTLRTSNYKINYIIEVRVIESHPCISIPLDKIQDLLQERGVTSLKGRKATFLEERYLLLPIT